MYSDRNQTQFSQNHVAKRKVHFVGRSFFNGKVLFRGCFLELSGVSDIVIWMTRSCQHHVGDKKRPITKARRFYFSSPTSITNNYVAEL